VDVTGIEPVTPCLQRLFARRINNLPEVGSNELSLAPTLVCAAFGT
jgi:hypothetical protein